MKHAKWALLVALVLVFSVKSFGVEKTAADSQWYVGFGPTFMGSVNSQGVGVGVELAKTFDLDTAAIRVLSNFAIRESAYMGQLGLGLAKYFKNGDNAPYIGGDLGFGFSKADGGGVFSGESGGGFVIGAIGGIQLFRTSEVSFDIGMRVALLLKETALGHPNLVGFRVGLVF